MAASIRTKKRLLRRPVMRSELHRQSLNFRRRREKCLDLEKAKKKAAEAAKKVEAERVNLEAKTKADESARAHVVNLAKEATSAAGLAGLGGKKFRVALALDVSASMDHFFRDGTVQEVVEKALGLGVTFDDNAAIDVFTFGTKATDFGELTADSFVGWVNKVKSSGLQYGTQYSDVIKMIAKSMHQRLVIQLMSCLSPTVITKINLLLKLR